MAGVWVATLISHRAWTWPVPMSIKVLYGAALLTVVGLLATVVLAEHAYCPTRTAMIAGAVGQILLEGLMVTAVALSAVGPAWPMAVALPASLIRILAIVRALPTMLAI
ncbi:hypothetical protein [Nonomuraea sp. NPDC049480]|uniref:hypothetical protein n=1 Tax=Nonomuraea sp. NPDC049480 TaxID=3364353 RepID=UPI0037921430